MGPYEKLTAFDAFKRRIYEYSGQQFEDFFTYIMTKANPLFRQVKPYGKEGDKKNDGYIQSNGEYFQVYAPENLQSTHTKTRSINKLHNDFQGLKEYWEPITPIKIFNFVVNDKFKGVPPYMYKAIDELQKKNPETAIKLFMANDLENVFAKLSDENIYGLVGYIPSPSDISLNFFVLDDLICYLLKSKIHLNGINNNLDIPDFEEKIKYNDINDYYKTCLKYSSYQLQYLENYFNIHNNIKNELQKIFIQCYKEAKEKFPKTLQEYSNYIFNYMVEQLNNPQTSHIKDAADTILVLLTYFFESCDIFERPLKNDDYNARETCYNI